MSQCLTLSAVASSLVMIITAGCNRVEKKPEPPPPMSVMFVTPTTEEVTEFEEFTGRTAATEVVELRSRVSGYLNSVHFEDGVQVKKGDVLFKIDDRPFVAEEQRASAAAAQIEARIKRLTSQLRRAEELMAKKALSENEFETAQFDLDEARAALQEAQAAYSMAQLNLEFTTITAPLDGRIGRRMVDVGNIVTTDQTALATIIPLEQVYVYFDIDERTVLRLRRLENIGAIVSAMKEAVQVNIALADSEEFAVNGKVDFLDNQIDPATGTLRARATVDNSDGLLAPGLFVRIKFPVGKAEPSLLIPEEAMASDQGRPFVFVVGKDGDKTIAEARNVETGPLVGQRRVIRAGLQAGDQVIVTGLQRLRRKMEINPRLSSPES
ncbi:MAG: efflux RND transporter periplasmic adaptor subunit [Planctomycetota bacterium]|nr:MAG: efflux RND transporter periplasmic adaptor subunit [Planctomycetota bacterium]